MEQITDESKDNIVPFEKFKKKRVEARAKYDIIGLMISKFIPDWLERDFNRSNKE